MIFPWRFRYCHFCRQWEVDTEPPFGWQPARRARGFGPGDFEIVRRLYRASDEVSTPIRERSNAA